MALISRARSAQYPLVAEYVFNYTDIFRSLATLGAPTQDANNRGLVTDFGAKYSQAAGQLLCLSGQTFVAGTNAVTTGNKYFEMIALPLGAQIIGGDMQVEAPFVGPSTVTLAISAGGNGPLYLAAQTLKAAAFAANITSITNAVNADGNYTSMNIVATNTGIAVGQTVTISGIVPAAYNGTFIVDAVNSTTDITVTNSALTAALTYVSGTAGTFLAGRTALSIPTESSVAAPSGASDASAGVDVRGTLLFTGGQAATQGRVRVRVMYTIDGKWSENTIT